jgi:hypothetical protein
MIFFFEISGLEKYFVGNFSKSSFSMNFEHYFTITFCILMYFNITHDILYMLNVF